MPQQKKAGLCTVVISLVLSSRDSLIVGLGMSLRGEVAMIVALLALQQHIIEQPSFVAIILMSLITTLIVPVLLRQLMKHQ